MSRAGLIAGVAAAALLVPAVPAGATVYCVGFTRAGCEPRATVAEAFADAVDEDRIELGDVRATAALADTGRTLTIAGSGEGVTELTGGLTLSNPDSQVLDVTVGTLALAGRASRIEATGPVSLRGTGQLRAALAREGADALDGTPRVESSVIGRTSGAALRVRCAGGVGARLTVRHVTLTGTPGALVQTDCAAARAAIADSILWGPAAAGFDGPGAVTTSHTDYRPQAGRPDGAGDLHVAPAFAPGGLRLPAGSPLADAGTPGPLGAEEYPEDRGGLPRVADGGGDPAPVRDLGAYELAPPPVPLPARNLLGDPGAERATTWDFTGGFVRERYGAEGLPSAAAGAALAAGDVLFAGGTGAAGGAAQLVGVTASAPEIDLGAATATLSGLLGGFRADDDRGVLRATFLGPGGQALGAVELTTPAPAERGNATALLARARTDAIPPLTRTVLVALEARHGSGRGPYTDAYFDNLGLTVDGSPAFPPVARRRAFAGVLVLARRLRIDRRGRLPVRVGCATRTVGRCRGAVTLWGALRRGADRHALSRARVAVRAGRTRFLRLPLARAERRAIRRRGRIRMRLYTSARDGQGVVRLTTVPVSVRPRRR